MGRENLDNIIKSSYLKSVAAREKAKAKPNPTAWRKIWDDTVREHFPECMVTYPDRASKNLQRAVNMRGLPVGDMPTFLPWIVKNWNELRKRVFSMNPNKPWGPKWPDMDMVIKYLPNIHAFYRTSGSHPGSLNLPRSRPSSPQPAETRQQPLQGGYSAPPGPKPRPPITGSGVSLKPRLPDSAKFKSVVGKHGIKDWD